MSNMMEKGIDFEEVLNMYNRIRGSVEDARSTNSNNGSSIGSLNSEELQSTNQQDMNLFNYSVEVNESNHLSAPDEDLVETYGYGEYILPAHRYQPRRVITVQEKRDMLLMLQGAMERGLITEEQFKQKRSEFLMSIRF